MQKGASPIPHWTVSLIPVAVLVILMILVIRTFGADALLGGSQVALIVSAAVAIGIAMLFYRQPWKKLEDAIADNMHGIGPPIVILLLIGAVSGTWMISGIVPTFICYGLRFIHPAIFLFAVCLICALISLVTGSSWTTIATIGVAMIAIGAALGYTAAWTAGAVISGAYFGDKISPLSDTTVLASSTAGVPIFTHIRYMLITTVPSFILALAVFLTASLLHTAPSAESVSETVQALEATFNITPWVLIVPAITIILIIKRVPAMLTLILSSAAAAATALICQSGTVLEIAGDASGSLGFSNAFKAIMVTVFGDTGIDCGAPACNDLIATHGMNGMLPTVFLIVCAATFGGILTGSGMIHSLTEVLTRHIRTRAGIVGATVGTGIFSDMATGDQYLSIILTCNLYRKLYEEGGYEQRLLSRSVEDSATVTSVLIPWNSCGMTQSTVLHVPTVEYLPYCFFNILSPLVSITVAALGYKIVRKPR